MLDALTPLAAPTSQASTIRQSAQEFEGMFLSTLLETMFSGLETEGPFGGGHSEKVYRSLMVQEYGKAIAQAGGIGIADSLEKELLSLQEIGQ
ncbi:MAG: rod-binding protein [Sphingomonadales bacterium]